MHENSAFRFTLFSLNELKTFSLQIMRFSDEIYLIFFKHGATRQTQNSTKCKLLRKKVDFKKK